MLLPRIIDAIAGAVGRWQVARSGSSPTLRELAVIGDRHTAAVVTAAGDIVWYCPGRFDAPILLGSLIHPLEGGSWRVDLPQASPAGRRYIGDSAILETTLCHPGGRLVITDWMTLPRGDVPCGALCRRLSAAPPALRLVLTPRPDAGRQKPRLRRATPRRVEIARRFQLHASHPLQIDGDAIVLHVPRGEACWAVLADTAANNVMIDNAVIDHWLAATQAGWHELAQRCSLPAGYEVPVAESLRALRLLTFEATGAVAAAVTTALPEIVGGNRNYDYRYAWLRDSGLAVRALLRFEPSGIEAKRFLGFVAGILDTGYRRPLDPVAGVAGERVPELRHLRFSGYRGSRPTWVGNRAGKQLQTGSFAMYLLAARELYEMTEPRLHWPAVSQVGDYLAEHWRVKDSGIWEERKRRQFTASKVFAACALEGLAKFADDRADAARFGAAAAEIRDYVNRHCRTPSGGYAAIAGTDVVDITAALFPVFDYCPADDPGVEITIRELDARCRVGEFLYHRHLQSAKVMRREGAFLPGTFWVAHYWILRGDLDRGRTIIQAGLRHANDLGLMPEEATGDGTLLGNMPLGLSHASFLAAVADYDEAMKKDAGPGSRAA